jgi:hypothetical protein
MANIPLIKLEETKTGDILLVCGSELLSKIIQASDKIEENKVIGSLSDQGYKFSHGAVIDKRSTTNKDCDEAEAGGIVKNSITDEYLNDDSIKSLLVLRLNTMAIPEIEAQTFLDQFTNLNNGFWHNLFHPDKTKYAFLNLPAFLIYWLTNKRIWLGTGSDDIKSFCCGDFCAFFINHFYKNSFPEHEKVAPVDLFMSPLFDHFILKQIQ